jgi:dTDP-4-dehydrorhamnose reductase
LEAQKAFAQGVVLEKGECMIVQDQTPPITDITGIATAIRKVVVQQNFTARGVNFNKTKKYEFASTTTDLAIKAQIVADCDAAAQDLEVIIRRETILGSTYDVVAHRWV